MKDAEKEENTKNKINNLHLSTPYIIYVNYYLRTRNPFLLTRLSLLPLILSNKSPGLQITGRECRPVSTVFCIAMCR
jgi:hypothetical protein